jgi:hypothetical protein
MIANMTVSILAGGAGNLTIDALMRVIEAQRSLPGRKAVIFFSEGLIVPPEQPERLRAIVSAANRANVAFYTLDPGGLDTISAGRKGRLISRTLNSLDPGGAAAKPTDFKENLRTLAIDTGGFPVTDTNDLRSPMLRIRSELRGHYEVSYSPSAFQYDAHFRPIVVRVTRSGVRVRSRSGYFALPIVGNRSVAPFETAGLAALSREHLPAAFEFHAGVSTFRRSATETECQAVFSMPTAALRATASAKEFSLHAAFVALIRDSRGQVVQKISRDLPFRAPAERQNEFRRGEMTVTLPFRVPPGRYILEAAARDVEAQAESARRISFFAPGPGTPDELPMSDLVLAHASESINERDPFDPLQCSAGKVIPESGLRPPQGIYIVLYPESGPAPEMSVSVVNSGVVQFVSHPEIPKPDSDGSIRILSRIPFEELPPGVYEVKAVATQGNRTARRTSVVEIRTDRR